MTEIRDYHVALTLGCLLALIANIVSFVLDKPVAGGILAVFALWSMALGAIWRWYA